MSTRTGTDSPTSSSPSRKPRKSPGKFDPIQVKAMAVAGLSHEKIALQQGVSRRTIWAFLNQSQIEQISINVLKDLQADALTRLRGNVLQVIDGVVQSVQRDIDNGVLDAQKPAQKISSLRDLSVTHGILHDKERLERNQSTENHSMIHRMMGSAFDVVHKPVITKESDGEPE